MKAGGKMVITWGIVTVIFLILTVVRKIKGPKSMNKFFIKTHTYWAYLFLLMGCIHMVLSFKLIATRYVLTYITGIAMILLGVFASVDCFKFKKKHSGFKKRHGIIAVLIIILLIAHVGITIFSLKDYENKVSQLTFEEIDVTKVPDGTFEGSCDVGYIYAKVAVEVKGGKLINIKLLAHQNERGKKAEQITDDMVAAQSLEVDAISGATRSSFVIKKAVENALKNAF